MMRIEIPEDILSSIKIPRNEVDKTIKRDLAISLYQRGAISLGKARKLAGLEKWEFLKELEKRKIPRHYTKRELKEDIEFAKSG
ncbi:MAG: UPF0175 family protein [Candidatus Thermoplasmatota archaeon]|nr:UPF0175 family protein [Candidatus Thermoplasmatota archaeon]